MDGANCAATKETKTEPRERETERDPRNFDVSRAAARRRSSRQTEAAQQRQQPRKTQQQQQQQEQPQWIVMLSVQFSALVETLFCFSFFGLSIFGVNAANKKKRVEKK